VIPFLPARDWGRQHTYVPWFAANPDSGLFVGAGVRFERFGFRTYPYRARHIVRGGYALGPNAFRGDYDGEFRLENSRVFLTVEARASQLEILHFYGLGNETPEPASKTFFEVRQTQLSLAPAVHVPLARRLTVSAGPTIEYASTRRSANRFIGQSLPYGSEPFGQLGAAAEIRLDTRDVPMYARRGVLLLAGGAIHPPAWAVQEAYGELHAEAAAHLSPPLPLRPTISLRAGAKRVVRPYPFHEAAFVGGADSLRGFPSQRFAGDASALGNAELRLVLGRYFLVLPGEYGVFALADAGRVWLEGERSNRWHTAVGGGLWFAYLRRDHTVTIAVARSDEATSFYLAMGFGF
jgi:outer membrane protein assembly factor BamA